MSEIKAFMEERAKILERQINYTRKQLNLYPKGTLAVRERSSGSYLCHIMNAHHGHPKEKVLNESYRKRAERIQTRVFMEAQIQFMGKSLKEVHRFLKRYPCCDPDTVRASLKPVYRDPLQYQGFLPPQSASVNTGESYANRFHPEELIHKNSIGELFRSKGEVQVSELLLNRKISYVYEPFLSLPDGPVYPDFKVTPTGTNQSKYIEYCGMLENDKYLKRTMEKLRNYLRGGYKPGRDILFFFEDGDNGMDVQIMKRDLENFLGLSS